jgi:hypothetical protein
MWGQMRDESKMTQRFGGEFKEKWQYCGKQVAIHTQDLV